ncbi:hypothetical protein [Microbacterium binotii]|uniref:hypothetical protein n=1 Tax=Microbacterium binotii TaxID=462710 RepID=UPI001F21C7B1|nr:hypothetical protein [Microbacterium binotii]UIN30918.1 hypothetical protein LXM64_01545 [Microbacterium binotii]
MTDARLRGEWLTAAAHDGLSDAAYRVLHNALMHSAEQGTDGAISRRELRFLYPGPLKKEVLDELTAAGFWAETDEGFQMIGWATTLGQSTAADVEAYRRNARERQRRRREKLSGTPDAIDDAHRLQAEGVTGDVTDSVTRDVMGNVGKDRTGPDRPVLAKRKNARASHDCERDGHVRIPAGGCLHCEIRPADLEPERKTA